MDKFTLRIPYKLDQSTVKMSRRKHLVLIIHGGCFVGGNETYDQSLVNCLLAAGYHTLRIKFKTTSFEDSMEDLVYVTEQLKEHFSGYRITIIGVSSGGFLAYKLISETRMLRVYHNYIGLCPVLHPYARHKIIVEKISNGATKLKPIKDGQLRYFGSEEHMKELSIIGDCNIYDVSHALMILGKDDENVPLETVKPFFDEFATSDFHKEVSGVYIVDGGHEICGNPPATVLDIVLKFLDRSSR